MAGFIPVRISPSLWRASLLPILLLIEAFVYTASVDLYSGGSHARWIAWYAPWILRSAVAFLVVTLTFAYPRRADLEAILDGNRSPRLVRQGFLASHLVAFIAFLFASRWLFQQSHPASSIPVLLVGLGILGLVSVALALLSFVPFTLWTSLWGALQRPAFFGLLAGSLAWILGSTSWLLWEQVTSITFEAVRIIVHPLVPAIQADAASRVLGTLTGFSIQVERQCSGIEGMGLILAFTTAWLIFFKRDYRFPHALLLIPAGLIFIYALNALRIAGLFLIGHYLSPDVAIMGFHSQAGWIAFNLAALLLVIGSRRIAWFSQPTLQARRAGSIPAALSSEKDVPVAAYLVPFLALLATGMFSRAVTGTFESTYPLRPLIAGYALWHYRREYSVLLRGITPYAFGIGVVVLGLWMARASIVQTPSVPPSAQWLALSPSLKYGWLFFRIASTSLIVPAAEELAFRGFLMRRLVSAEFHQVPWKQIPWHAVVFSSLAFGLLHAGMYVEGTLAGVFYAWAVLRRGNLTDAIAAHGITNALLAAYALFTGDWKYW